MEVAKAKPITALILGLIAGIAIAVLLQQAGVWPLDKLTVFLLPGLVALLFVVVGRIGRQISPIALAFVLILLLIPIGYGLTGLGELNQNGEINRGCTVEASSAIDSTVVTDTSRSDPFQVQPEGPLSWFATSPTVFMDHNWEIWVVVGGFEFVVADGGSENRDGETINDGDVPTLQGYVDTLTQQSGEQIRGVYEVGGFIEGADGAGCDGFGFVVIEGGFLSTIISLIALIVLIVVIIIFLLIVLRGRSRTIPDATTEVSAESPSEPVL